MKKIKLLIWKIKFYIHYKHPMKLRKDGSPTRCPYCKERKLVKGSSYHENYYEVEYEVICSNCNKRVAIWAYGYWSYL